MWAIILLIFAGNLLSYLAYIMNVPGSDSLQPGSYWVILHMIYTPIMSNSLVEFVTFSAVTNVLTHSSPLKGVGQ